jgi:hypothetical protein
MTSRWLSICALIHILVATSAASGEPVSSAAGNSSGTAIAKGVMPSGRSVPTTSVPTSTQTVRMVIATFLERQERFRKYDDDGAPKLVKASIAGPADFTPRFSRKPPISIYCIQVDLIMTNRILWMTHDVVKAVITFPPAENGRQRIEGKIWSGGGLDSYSMACKPVPFTPFSELERLVPSDGMRLAGLTSPEFSKRTSSCSAFSTFRLGRSPN